MERLACALTGLVPKQEKLEVRDCRPEQRSFTSSVQLASLLHSNIKNLRFPMWWLKTLSADVLASKTIITFPDLSSEVIQTEVNCILYTLKPVLKEQKTSEHSRSSHTSMHIQNQLEDLLKHRLLLNSTSRISALVNRA